MSSSDTAVDDDIITKIASENDIERRKLVQALTKQKGPSYEMLEIAEKCYSIQRLRNEIGTKLKKASENDEFKLVDSEGYVFWVDEYDGFGAYIHSDEGDSYYISLPQLKEFEFNNV